MSRAKVKNNQLAKLREFRQGMDVEKFLTDEWRQVVRALENQYVDTDFIASSISSDRGLVGEIKLWPGVSLPENYLWCKGELKAISEIPELAAVLYDSSTGKYAFGSSGTSVYLPDMRGAVPRGPDGGSGKDPDNASRTALNANGNTGNNVGSYQSDQFASHDHTIGVYNTGGGTVASQGAGGLVAQTQLTGARGGNETRMKNVYLNYIIRYKN